jgi:hypothetical protein
MFGIPKKWIDAGGRASAAAGIGIALLSSGTPALIKGNTDLSKQYTDYSKDVRLPETRRDINRALRTGARVNNAYRLAGTQQINTKDLKNLKKK